MNLQTGQPKSRTPEAPLLRHPAQELSVSRLTDADREEVLVYLAARVIDGFGLIGFVRRNGLSSPENRGTFYACRNEQGGLEGVALIGHAILMAANNDAAIAVFARLAQQCRDAFMFFGERETAQTFWGYYAERGQRLRLQCRELLFEQRRVKQTADPVAGLRPARMADLDAIVPVHARLAYEESGVNPMDADADGFRARCARRIEQKLTWVWNEGGKLIFKADIITDAPEIIYLEGIDVHPDERGRGYGRRCLQQLTRMLLERTQSVVLLVNAERPGAQTFYGKAGFELIGCYDTLFLKPDVQ
jgi:ribosomal protein S18 acetylase RimI-like enzyme